MNATLQKDSSRIETNLSTFYALLYQLFRKQLQKRNFVNEVNFKIVSESDNSHVLKSKVADTGYQVKYKVVELANFFHICFVHCSFCGINKFDFCFDFFSFTSIRSCLVDHLRFILLLSLELSEMLVSCYFIISLQLC